MELISIEKEYMGKWRTVDQALCAYGHLRFEKIIL